MHPTAAHDPLPFFHKQTIFLTGGTGLVGGCLLFKLAMKLDTGKIYALVRGSPERAVSQLRDIIPNQVDAILATNKVKLVVGDICEHKFGIDPVVLAEMARTVTVIIHSAASISLRTTQRECVEINCLPVLQLAQMSSSFENLSKFVFISTAYANSHLPDGVIEERIYPGGDAEQQLSRIMEAGSLAEGLAGFTHAYTLVKNITEQLLLSRNPHLPILIVRPTCIAPAISQPHPYYSRPGSSPGSGYVQRYMESPDSGVFHVSSFHPTGTNIVDEIPVDITANLILLHIMHDTRGIVHAGSESYVRRTLAQLHQTIIDHFPRRPGSRRPEFRYLSMSDRRVPQGRYAEFLKTFGRDWHFSNAASQKFVALEGPLSIALGDHDAGRFMDERAGLISADVVRRRSSKASAKL